LPPAEVDLPSGDELVVDAASRLNAKCQSALFRCALANRGGDGDTPGGGLGDGHPVDPVGVARGQGAGVIAVLGLARQPAPALVMGNDLEVPR
jgi:hypothetical protein